MEDTILCLSYNVFPCELVPLVRILIVSRKHHSKHTQAPSKVKYIESPIFILGSRKMLASDLGVGDREAWRAAVHGITKS